MILILRYADAISLDIIDTLLTPYAAITLLRHYAIDTPFFFLIRLSKICYAITLFR